MDWILEDWEYPTDEIYAIERQRDLEMSLEKPIEFKIINKTKNDINKSPKVRGINKEVI
jgi:HD-like signal output (HDOD) protein